MPRKNEYDLAAAFQKIEDELIASMIRNMDRHRAEETKEGYNWSMWQAEQLKALEKYKVRNQKKYSKQFKSINDQIDSLIRMSRSKGGMHQERRILQAIKKGWKVHGTNRSPAHQAMTAEFFKLNDRKLEALIKATRDDMEKAETAVLRKANDDYRKAIFNAQVYANTGAGTYEKAVDMATKDMLSRGLNCVEYANGARHTLSDYADMAIRTASKRAYLQGEGEKRKEWGIATVIMAKRGNPCPKCLPFVGKVLIDDVWSGGSKDGVDPETGKKYPLMSYAISKGLYHPRCKDSHTTYFPGISTADDTWTKEELEAIGLQNQQEARQQYAQRQEEKYKRLAKYSLDQDNQKLYERKANIWDSEVEKGTYLTDIKRIGSNDVDLEYIKADEFRKKFNKITENTSVNDALRKYATAMLTHRNKTDGEDLYIINTQGKLLLRKISGKNELGVEISVKESQMLRQQHGIIGIHNHPTNILPTGSDFVAAGYRKYDFGIVVTHSGKVYKYGVGQKPFLPRVLDDRIDKYTNPPYNLGVEKAHIRALNDIVKEYGIIWQELK